jgi:hypothetical protein
MSGTFAAVSRWWWEVVPRAAGRLAWWLGAALRDGRYVTAVPPLGALAPLAALVAGLVLGAGHYGQHEIYTTSLTVLIAFVCVAAAGAAFGFWLWLGYVLGDLLIYEPSPSDYLRQSDGTWISYVLLAFLLVVVPLVAARLRRELWPLTGRLGRWRFLAEAPAVAASSGFLVYVWGHATSYLIRAVYPDNGLQPVAPFVQLQLHTHRLAWIAALAAAARVLVEAGFEELRLRRPPTPQPVPAWLASAGAAVSRAARPVTSWIGAQLRRIPQPVRVLLGMVVQAALAAFVLLGLVSRREAALLGLAFLGILVARRLLSLVPFWARAMNAIPLAARLIVGWFLAEELVRRYLHPRLFGSSLSPIAVSGLIAFAVFAVLTPPAPPAREPGEGGWRRLLVAFAAAASLVLALPGAAAADNCSSLSDCQEVVRDTTAVAAGIGVLLIVLFTFSGSDPCKELRSKCREAQEEAAKAQAEADRLRKRADELAKQAGEDRAKAIRDRLAQLDRDEANYMEGTAGRLKGMRLNADDLKRLHAEEQEVRARYDRGEIGVEERERLLARWADEDYLRERQAKWAGERAAERQRLNDELQAAEAESGPARKAAEDAKAEADAARDRAAEAKRRADEACAKAEECEAGLPPPPPPKKKRRRHLAGVAPGAGEAEQP